MQRDTEAADKYAAMVRELDPKNEHGHLEMVVINADIIPLLQQKKWGEAAIKAEDFIANMTPKKRGDELYYYAAIGRLQSGDKEKGKAHLNKLLELYPKSRIAPRAKKILQQVGG
jgi:TolA-binding protein